MLARLLYYSGVAGLATRLRHDPALLVFNYHRIRPDGAFATPFDDGVFGPTAREFKRHVEWLQAHTKVLSEDETAALVQGGKPPARVCTLITFDDGYRDNYDLAYPLLRKHNAPALFFVPTAQVEERTLGWWDLISYLVKKCRRDSITLRGETCELATDRSGFIRRMQDKMKRLPAQETATLVRDLEEACEVPLPDTGVMDRELMTWEQLRHMAAGGMAIGSHTHSHRVLATMDARAQRRELMQSRSLLEQRLGAPVRSLSYPVGGYRHFTEETRRAASEAGYELAFSFNTGVNRPGKGLDPMDIRRLGDMNRVGLLAAVCGFPCVFGRAP